jgi:hypothetical protein
MFVVAGIAGRKTAFLQNAYVPAICTFFADSP